jgi:hypothetical protein
MLQDATIQKKIDIQNQLPLDQFALQEQKK